MTEMRKKGQRDIQSIIWYHRRYAQESIGKVNSSIAKKKTNKSNMGNIIRCQEKKGGYDELSDGKRRHTFAPEQPG